MSDAKFMLVLGLFGAFVGGMATGPGGALLLGVVFALFGTHVDAWYDQAADPHRRWDRD